MRVTNKPAGRGFILGYVLIVSAVLAIIAMMLLQSAQYAARGTQDMEEKNGSFDAAEAGLNNALDALDNALSAVTGRSATLPNGYHYTYNIYPNFAGGLPLPISNPLTGAGLVNIPALGAIIISTGTGPNGDRPATVEAAVTADVLQLTYPHYAVVSGLNIQGTYGAVAGMTPLNAYQTVVLHANGDITARATASDQGAGEASGTTDTMPPGTTGTTQVPLPTVSQFDYMVTSYKNQASLLPGVTGVYQAGGSTLQPSYACGLPNLGLGVGCVLFYDGSLSVTSQQTTFTGPWTMVVNGDLQTSGRASLVFTSKPSALVVNGNAAFAGDGSINGYVQVKGSTSFSGDTSFNGALMTLGTLTFNGGSDGGFVYDPSVIPPSRVLVGLVKIVTYAEY
jgi:hypothetical protein